MYKKIIRPILFFFNPETIHNFTFLLFRTLSSIPFGKKLVENITSGNKYNKPRVLFGLKFPNQIGLAAGLDKNASVYEILYRMGFGFIEIGTTTPKGQPGNPKPRSFRLRRNNALINRMGFNNKGLDETIRNLRKKPSNLIIGGNIGKNTLTDNENAAKDYLQCFEKLFDYVDYFVVNVSCPNIKDLRKLQDNESLMDILGEIQNNNNAKPIRKPILLKISPDLNEKQLLEIIEIVNSTGIDGIVACNTTTKREGLSYSKEEIDRFGKGGLSGKPLKKRSLEVVRFIKNHSDGKIPVIGVGGIMNPEDAIDMIEAGADLIQIYTGFIYEGPSLVRNIKKVLFKHY